MASQTSVRHSRRPRGAGSRRRNDDRSYRPKSTTGSTKVAAPLKLTLWEKIMGFFNGTSSNPPIAKVPQQPRNGSGSSHQQQPREDRDNQSARTPRPKPESVAVTTPRLYVGNLSFEATESDLFELFNGVGQVQNAEVVTYKHNQRSKGFAFVQMNTVEEAQRAVTELHDKEFLGRKLLVSGAKSTDRASDS